jgi:UrcA family protein
MKDIVTAAWAAALLVTALPATAAEPDLETRSVKVVYSDLNLASEGGVSRLQSRVSGAIRQVCGGPTFGLQESLQQHACENNARTAASRDVQNAITSARQLPNPNQTVRSTATVDNRAASPSAWQPWSRRSLISRH